MFRRLGRFDGPILREALKEHIHRDGGACVWDVNWVTCVGVGVYIQGHINGILHYFSFKSMKS